MMTDVRQDQVQGNRFGLYHEQLGQKFGGIKDDLAKMRENLQKLNHRKLSKTKASLLGDRSGQVGSKLLSYVSIDEGSDREKYPTISATITDIPKEEKIQQYSLAQTTLRSKTSTIQKTLVQQNQTSAPFPDVKDQIHALQTNQSRKNFVQRNSKLITLTNKKPSILMPTQSQQYL